MTTKEKQINYAELLKEVTTKEGSLSACYENFHNFSLLNSLYAMMQMRAMGLPITPIACGSKWRELNRTIKDTEKYRKIELCRCGVFQPKDANGQPMVDDNGNKIMRKYFKYEKNWYCLAQTTGDNDFNINKLNEKYKNTFDFKQMLNKLSIVIKDFEELNGNVQGYTHCIDNKIAINPMAQHSAMTIIHEVAHVLLHKRSRKAKEIKELEAETTAYIVGKMLGISENELANSRGYIQNWYGKGKEIPQDSASEIIKTADMIYKAGLKSKGN